MEFPGRHFVLHVLKFVFEVAGRRQLPLDIQKWINRYRPDEKSIFNGKIVEAIIIYIIQYMDDEEKLNELADITSRKFRNLLKRVDNSKKFLEFVGIYSVKVFAEFSNVQLKSPPTFFTLVTDFFANILVNEGSVSEYVKTLKKSAEEILNEDQKLNKGIFPKPIFGIEVDKEKWFLVDVINCVFDIFEVGKEIKLQSENSVNLVTPSIKNTFLLIVQHHDKQFLSLGDYELLKKYFHKRCIKKFNWEDFLELCVCCTRNVAFGLSVEISLESSENACDFLLEILHCAKGNENFTSFQGMHEAAKDLKRSLEKLYQPTPLPEEVVFP